MTSFQVPLVYLYEFLIKLAFISTVLGNNKFLYVQVPCKQLWASKYHVSDQGKQASSS